MARLFIGQKEIQFVNDLTKEWIKDVIGQVIHYFPVSSIKSEVHGVYNESVRKVFENPIKIPARVAQPEWSSKTTNFGPDIESKLEVMIQYKDLQDKGIVLAEGDFFSYDDFLYEILTVTILNNIFGLAEYNTSWKITGRSSRLGQLELQNLPPPRLASPDEIQQTFIQQRGLPIDSSGEYTNDIREMRERLNKDMAPIALGTGPKLVEPNVNENGDFIEGKASSFNNDPPVPKKGIYNED
jgi:hypothetical protein